MDEREYITTTEAARLLSIQPHTLRVWRGQGRGPKYVRLSGDRGRVIYSRAAVLEWLASRTYRSTSEEAAAAAGAL